MRQIYIIGTNEDFKLKEWSPLTATDRRILHTRSLSWPVPSTHKCLFFVYSVLTVSRHTACGETCHLMSPPSLPFSFCAAPEHTVRCSLAESRPAVPPPPVPTGVLLKCAQKGPCNTTDLLFLRLELWSAIRSITSKLSLTLSEENKIKEKIPQFNILNCNYPFLISSARLLVLFTSHFSCKYWEENSVPVQYFLFSFPLHYF